MNKFFAMMDLFRKGEALSQPGIWSNAANLGVILAGLIMGILNMASAYGHPVPIPISLEQANELGLAISTVIAFIANNITNKSAGLLPAKPPTANDLMDITNAAADAAMAAAKAMMDDQAKKG